MSYKRWKAVLVFVLLAVLWAMPVWAQEPNVLAPETDKGWTAWLLLGTNPEFAKSEEIRVGYEGLLPDLELAVGGVHLEAPDDSTEEWSGRGYVIFHALDAQMVGSFIGNGVTLPDGNLYGGLFGQYTYDREEEWSGGYIVGGLVDWPKGWQTVAEYQALLWNSDDNSYVFTVGLRRRFGKQR